MDLTMNRSDGKLHIKLTGELDHHAAKDIVGRLSGLTSEAVPKHCVLDMGGVGFMDSSGIAVVLGLYKRLSEVDSQMTVRGTPQQAMKVFNAAGIDKIITFE